MLAHAPARCGAPADSWIDSNELGTVGTLGLAEDVPVDLISLLLLTEGILLGSTPDHDVAMQQFSYTTQDRGQLVEATALVAFPTDLPPDAPPNEPSTSSKIASTATPSSPFVPPAQR